jgi:hypothetical protein
MESELRPCKRNKDMDMMLSTWDVRSLYRPGALAKLFVKEELNRLGSLWRQYRKLDGVEVKSLILEIL